jgi:tetratricopeptide (TPR) repeat protein
MSELREAIRADSAATDAALVLARIHFERGEYKLAVNFANSFVKAPTRPRRDQGYVVGIRALTAQKDFERARKTLDIMKPLTNDEALVTLETARIDHAEHGAKVAVATIDASGLDLTQPENELLLRYWMDQQIELGRADRALARVDSKIEADPDSAASHELRGSVLATMNRSDEARIEFEKTLQIDPENAVAVGGLATLAARGGDISAGVQGFDRAAKLKPREPAYAYSAAQLTLATGDKAGAEKRLREIVRFAPGHAGARNDLAWLLAEKKEDLDLALALAEEARRIDPSPEILDTLGYVHLQRGETTAAVATLELAAEANDSPSIRYRLGTALNQAGDEKRAQEMLEAALAAGAFPEREEAQRQLAALKQR